MKQRVVFLLFFYAFATTSFAATVTGAFVGENPLQTVSVSYLTNDFITTAPVNPDGTFTLSLNIKQADCLAFTFTGINGVQRQLYFTVSPADKINLKMSVTYDDLVISEAKGSADVAFLKMHQDKMNAYHKEVMALDRAYATARESVDRQRIQTEYYSKVNAFGKQMEPFYLENKTLLTSLLLAYVNFSHDFNAHKQMFKTLYNSVSAKYSYSALVSEVATKVTNPIEIGAMAPELEGVTPDGKTIKLSDLRGKYVLVDFWASWCRPCRGENPNVVAAYNKYKGKKFDVFSVSLDRNADSWKAAIEADGLVWKNHICTFQHWNCPQAKKYRVSSIPFSVLVGPDGKIVAISLRGEALQSKLAEVLK